MAKVNKQPPPILLHGQQRALSMEEGPQSGLRAPQTTVSSSDGLLPAQELRTRPNDNKS